VVRYQTLKNVNERIFAETKYAGKWLKNQCNRHIHVV
jgi:hypothetical protein